MNVIGMGLGARSALTSVALVAVVIAGLAAVPASAQETDSGTTHEKAPSIQYWFKICPERKGPDGKPFKICVTQHEQFNQRSGELNVAVAIRQQEGKKDKLLLTVPLGVALPTGIAVKFDKIKEPLKFTYVFCHAEGCVVDTAATKQIIDAMRKGAVVNMSVFHTFYNRPVSFSVPLKGFTKVLEGPPVDGNNYFQRRRQLRLQIRKRSADAIKKAREAQAGKKKTAPAQ